MKTINLKVLRSDPSLFHFITEFSIIGYIVIHVNDIIWAGYIAIHIDDIIWAGYIAIHIDDIIWAGVNVLNVIDKLRANFKIREENTVAFHFLDLDITSNDSTCIMLSQNHYMKQLSKSNLYNEELIPSEDQT